MMDAAIKAQWLAALRSGDYRQGKGALHYIDPEGDSFLCCLGVLCVMAEYEGVTEGVQRSGTEFISYEEMTALPPESVSKWAGATHINPAIIEDRDGAVQTLGHLNDEGLTFEQMADVIEYFV
jgi:hypothetical protein